MEKLSKEEQWRRHIEACANSGMSVKAWCEDNNLLSHQYYYWKKKFAAAENAPADGPPQWASLTIQASPGTDSKNTPIILQIGKFKLELRKGFDPQALVELIEILGGLC